jgi:hypothetical protein
VFADTDPLAFAVLSLYTNNEPNILSMLQEKVVDSQNLLVRRTIWSTVTILRALKLLKRRVKFDDQSDKSVDLDLESYYIKLTYDYASELEANGLWQWAIFVVLHLENAQHKTKYVKQTLLKNICNPNSQEATSFLIEKCKLPAHYVHEARAIWYNSIGEYGKSFYEWIKACENPKNSNEAFKTLIKNLALSLNSSDYKYDDLETVLDGLSKYHQHIDDWEEQGKFLTKFVQIRKEICNYHKEFIDEYDVFKHTERANVLNKAKNDVVDLLNKVTDLIKVLKRFKIDTLSSSTKPLKVEIERILLKWDVKLKIIDHQLNPVLGHINLPNEYLIESQNLTITEKNDAIEQVSHVVLCQQSM